MYSKKIDPATKATLDLVPDLDYFARRLRDIDPMGRGNPMRSDIDLQKAYEAVANNAKDREDFLDNDPKVKAFRQKFQADWALLQSEMISKGGKAEYLSDILHALHYGDYIIKGNGTSATPPTPNAP